MSAEKIEMPDEAREPRRVQREKNRAGIALLESRLRETGDPTCDSEFWPQVKAGLDEGRGPERKLFND